VREGVGRVLKNRILAPITCFFPDTKKKNSRNTLLKVNAKLQNLRKTLNIGFSAYHYEIAVVGKNNY